MKKLKLKWTDNSIRDAGTCREEKLSKDDSLDTLQSRLIIRAVNDTKMCWQQLLTNIDDVSFEI